MFHRGAISDSKYCMHRWKAMGMYECMPVRPRQSAGPAKFVRAHGNQTVSRVEQLLRSLLAASFYDRR
eukprot:2352319-Rhodomonas_salina.1